MLADNATLSDTGLTPVSRELQVLLLSHLEKHPALTLNAISKRCAVSEPTLRRIAKGKIKTDPSVDTVIDLLNYLLKENDLQCLLKVAPPALKKYLARSRPQSHISPVPMPSVPELTQAFENPVNYLIYSLAANDGGVSKDHVGKLFGQMGLGLAEDMVAGQLLTEDNQIYSAVYENFVPPLRQTRSHMKSLLDFLKSEKIGTSLSTSPLSPLAHYMTNGINSKAYQEIRKIQSKATLQCAKILFDPNNRGKIPAFLLMALDTLSNSTAYDSSSSD